MSMMMAGKTEIRDTMQARRKALPAEWIEATSQRIAERFMDLDVYRSAETVCVYLAIDGEVRLDAVIEECWEANRRLLVPAFRKEQRDYGLKALTRDSGLVRGPWNVPEPDTDAWAETGGATCMAVPGVAFDDAGGRVGHGGGYYDRLLETVGKPDGTAAIGVCFDFQRIESAPREAWDVDMDMVVSESRVARARSEQ